MKFCLKLKQLREAKKITQEELAKQIFVSRSLIARYENGSVIPTKENTEKLASYFNLSVKELLDEDYSNLTLEKLKQINDDYLRKEKLENRITFIFLIIIIVISVVFVLFSLLPLLKGYRFVYPIPEGQITPNKEYYYTSLLLCTMKDSNYIVLLSEIICLINVFLSFLYLALKNKRNLFAIKIIIYIGFIVSLFFMLFSILFGFSFMSGSRFD